MHDPAIGIVYTEFMPELLLSIPTSYATKSRYSENTLDIPLSHVATAVVS